MTAEHWAVIERVEAIANRWEKYGSTDLRTAARILRAEIVANRWQPASLTAEERQFLTFALDLAFDAMVSGDGFTDEDDAALAKFRRMAAAPAGPDESPLSPFSEHPACGFHWRGRDGMDIPMRDGQPVCPRCELRRMADEAQQAEAAVERVRQLHRAVDYHHTRICAECSGYDGLSCDNRMHEWPCATAEALDRTEETDR